MKQIIFIMGIYILFLGCAELGTALSQMNEDMGAECAIYSTSVDLYIPKTGKYKENWSMDIDRSWVSRRQNYYSSLYSFRIYYETSPNGYKYRFHTQCSRYH